MILILIKLSNEEIKDWENKYLNKPKTFLSISLLNSYYVNNNKL